MTARAIFTWSVVFFLLSLLLGSCQLKTQIQPQAGMATVNKPEGGCLVIKSNERLINCTANDYSP
ncbi:hypothetical protein WA1_49405 [Scytonema hofmannii PCC 7110]|uniref:Uncharacterized protein n=1 Tax=Scytonema hofmannii PCC 7110 TaxID=128403 RepID=A0A139WQR1_9CYAN|nr:hypothetical protein [Scytonema hofmannii]KYC34757.1 hypothetical protein WA1_49405 [Scytonema hofmannii PCC 7110]